MRAKRGPAQEPGSATATSTPSPRKRPHILGHVVAYLPGAFAAQSACRFIVPAQPTLVAKPPAGPEWVHEVKHDGYWLLARKQAGRVARRGE